MGDRLPGSQLTESFLQGTGSGIVEVQQGLSGGQSSVLLRFLLNVLESHVFNLCCFGLISACRVRFGETDSGLGAREGTRGSGRVEGTWGVEGSSVY